MDEQSFGGEAEGHDGPDEGGRLWGKNGLLLRHPYPFLDFALGRSMQSSRRDSSKKE